MPYFDGLIVEVGLIITFEIVILIRITSKSPELRALYFDLSYVPRALSDFVPHMLSVPHML